MGAERRRAPRFRIDQMFELSIGREHGVRCQAVDLSEVGLYCRTETLLEPGTRVFVLIGLGDSADSQKIRCEGVVVRSAPTDQGFEAGIGFSDLSAASRAKLADFLSRHGG